MKSKRGFIEMKNLIYVLFALFLSTNLATASELKLGKPITLTDITKVSDISKNPEQYIGKEVLVEGLIIDVCSSRGCWMDIASDAAFEKIQIKVVDGVIVFPMEAKGKMAKIQGVVEELKLSKKQAIEQGEHRAEEQGIAFDPSTITGPTNYYRVRAKGALIN